MKKFAGLLICVLLMIGLAQAADLIEYECGDFVYTLNAHGNASIVDYTGNAVDLVFPSQVDGYPVTSIFAAVNSEEVRTVHIPEGVTVLGDFALSECDNLETVFLPNTLRVIGCFSLGCCPSIRNIHLPENLIIIDEEAFDYCISLPHVTFPSGFCYLGDMTFNNHASFAEPYFVTDSDAVMASQISQLVINKDAVKACGDYLYKINDNGTATIVLCTASGNVVVPETLDGYSVTEIGESAFVLASDMETLILPSTITSIGETAFRRCEKLNTVVLPKNLVEIKAATFAYCTALSNVLLPQNLAAIQDFAFYDCQSLSQLLFPSKLEIIGRYAFYNCFHETMIPTVPPTVEIGEEAFYPYKTEPAPASPYSFLQDDVESDYERKKEAQNKEAVLEDFIYVLNEDETITLTAYTGQSRYVHIPAEINGYVVTAIGKHAFANHYFNQLTFPDTITSIGDGAFSGCIFYEPIILPKNLTTIGTASFCNVQIEEDSSVYEDERSFLPDTLISIGDYAFYHAYLEEDLIIPASVAEIGEWAFAVPQFGNGTFVLLCSDVQIGENAFYGDELTVPAGSPLVQYCLDSGISYIEYEVEIHTGNTVTFGSCNEEKLSWIVLRSDEETTTMICEHVVGIMPFGRKNNEWSSSCIRSWLNDEFASAAFNETERSALVPVQDDLVRIPGLNDLLNDEYCFSAGRDTVDPLRTAFGFGGSIANLHMLSREKNYPYYTLTAASDRSLYQVRANGSIGMAKYDRDNVGIRPMITVKTEALK